MTQIFSLPGMLARCAAVAVLLASASVANAQQSFKSPEDAAAALASATKDSWPKGVIGVLGPDGVDIVSSGDKVADEEMREKFLAAYAAKHEIAMQGADKAVMVIGADDFPFPIPLARKGATWQFDTAEGRMEILVRRIGRNELNAIQACLAYVDAQNEYADKARAKGGGAVYAQRIVSRPGKKDGLYWPSTPGDESPLGEEVARAAAEGYALGNGQIPYHGYYYKVLTRQGPMAAGGEVDYIARGKMIGGFALVAYPAEYGNSGVMTFVVNYAGTVFQKDLGERTARIASRMSEFNPDQTWKKVEVPAAK
jgi:hypothetical protein